MIVLFQFESSPTLSKRTFCFKSEERNFESIGRTTFICYIDFGQIKVYSKNINIANLHIVKRFSKKGHNLTPLNVWEFDLEQSRKT